MIFHNIDGQNVTTTNMTSIVITDNTVMPAGVYIINVSAVNDLGIGPIENILGT